MQNLKALPTAYNRCSYLSIVFWVQRAAESLINQEKSELYLYTSIKHLVYQGFSSKCTILDRNTYYYSSHDELEKHLQAFIDAYNFARRLKTLNGLTI